MENQLELPFDGFKRFVQDPFEINDPVSFEHIKRIFIEAPQANTDPFRLMLQKLSGKSYSGKEAKDHWQHILIHKEDMTAKLGRRVSATVAATDYFDATSTSNHTSKPLGQNQLQGSLNREDWINRVYAPGYHLEKLKEEMMRSKRYKHALSTIMLDIDEFHAINQNFSFKTGDELLTVIVKIIKKTIRAVDILTRYSGDCFLIILPNTNKREATELAERLRSNIVERTKRIEYLPQGVTATLSVGQSGKDDNSTDYMKSLERTLEEGKKLARNHVYNCETS